MARPRNLRWIFLCTVLVLLIYVHQTPSENWTFGPRFQIVKSSYDWAQREPQYPVISMQSLPSQRPLKLPKIQHKPTKHSRFDIAIQERRRELVKSTLAKSWKSYKEFAWMRDELKPVTAGAKDTFGGWAATAVDALDTLWIMGMKTEFYEAVQAIVEIDWDKTQSISCNIFETNIRHLGGLLAAYDLSKERALLDKAVELGEMLYASFDTPNHMPPFWLNYEQAKKGLLQAEYSMPAAAPGSLSLEFTRLAQLTQNMKYYDAVNRITDHLERSQNATKIPGMWPTQFDMHYEDFVSDLHFTIGAQSDSLYEYLLKMQLMLGGTEPKYEKMYREAADTIIKHILFRPMTPDNLDILFAGNAFNFGNITQVAEGQHLACFAGGMFAMGGKLLDIPEHIDIGARLTRGCIWAYDSFPSGIMPELFQLLPCDSLDGCSWNEATWKAAVVDTFNYLPEGYLGVRDPRYLLRPEALESVFILYRITGQEEYREAAWRMFQNVVRVTDTQYGNSAIDDVRVSNPKKLDSQESFWLAETLKYVYLTFSPPDVISLDDYVLNTEAHPLKIPKR